MNSKDSMKCMIQDIPVEKEQPWYNDECKEKKFTFLYMLDKFRDNKTDENRKNMVKARSEYKKLIRKCRYNYDKGQTNKFLSAKYTNAKLYWNMLKELSNVKPANIPLSSFEQYFKSVNNPDDPFYTPDEDILHFNERYAENDFFFFQFNSLFTPGYKHSNNRRYNRYLTNTCNMAAIVIIILLGKQQKKSTSFEKQNMCQWTARLDSDEYTNKHTASKKRSIIIDTTPFRRRIPVGYLYKLLSIRE